MMEDVALIAVLLIFVPVVVWIVLILIGAACNFLDGPSGDTTPPWRVPPRSK